MLTEREQDRIRALARACAAYGKKDRTEDAWIRERCEEVRKAEDISNREMADRRLFELTFGTPWQKNPDSLKVRYWRTGRHLPKKRETVISFGKALRLNDEEMNWLIRSWYDHSTEIFTKEDQDSPLYKERLAHLSTLADEFVSKFSPEELEVLAAPGTKPRENLRHMYCMAARRLNSGGNMGVEYTHSSSIPYASEFTRQMLLLGEIPRSSMVRHLVIFCLPFVNRTLLDQELTYFGFMPLSEDHLSFDGSAQDRALIGLLDFYEETCTGKSPEFCAAWLREAAREFDEEVVALEKPGLRLFWFRHLGKEQEA